jgi:hypothetical protein
MLSILARLAKEGWHFEIEFQSQDGFYVSAIKDNDHTVLNGYNPESLEGALTGLINKIDLCER